MVMDFRLKKCFIPLHPLTNFEIQKYYQNELRFNGVYSRGNLLKRIKNGAYLINLDKYADVATNWIALYVKMSKLLILTILQLNIFIKELKNLLDINS